MSTTKKVCLALMIIGLVVCYFLFGIAATLWLALAFIICFGVIFFSLVLGKTNTAFISVAPSFMIAAWVIGAVIFWLLFGWQVAVAYLILYFAFTFVQPNAR